MNVDVQCAFPKHYRQSEGFRSAPFMCKNATIKALLTTERNHICSDGDTIQD